MLTRRSFLQATALSAAVPAAVPAAAEPKRIAILAGTYPPHMANRFLVGYPYGGAWRKPAARVVSLYVAQQPEGDLSASRAREFGFRLYPSVAEALRCGGPKLAVDAVLIASTPRSETLTQCIRIFEQDGRALPVFHDGPLSSTFEQAKAAVSAAHRLRFPLLAGSSLPFTWRLPSIELPLGCRIEEALMVSGRHGGEFPALDGLQCMLERRTGGETGVKAVQLLEGEAAWKAGYSQALLAAALSRSDTPQGLTVQDGRTQDLVASGELQKLAANPAAYCVEYRDGTRATLLMVEGAIQDTNFAVRLSGPPHMQSTQFLITPEPNATHSACLAYEVEKMFATGASTCPAERALLAGGILQSCASSKEQGHARIETPHLNLAYSAPGK